MLSLDAYAWYAGILSADESIPSGVRYVPQYPVPSKVCQSLYQDGHEHITSCLSFYYRLTFPLEGRKYNTQNNGAKLL